MRGLRIPASTTWLLCGCLQLAGTTATAAACDGSSDPCSVDLGRATASFAAGAATYYAEAVLTNGSDASVSPSPQSLPALLLTHAASSDGFSIQPQVYTYVGGSGVQGLHEVAATLQFTGLSFTADAGYQISSVQAVIKGSFSLVGNGYGGLMVPAALQWSGTNFSTTLALDPMAADFSIGFNVSASYLAGDDGTAVSYGAGSASFDSVEFIVNVTTAPVPEPASAALLAAGIAALPWMARRRRRA
jgi:PEP-CTERM motif